MQPRHVSILGVGLLGGSIGLAVKQRIKSCLVTGYGHRRPTLEAALQSGAIDQAYDDPAQAVRGADLVILCTPVGVFAEMLQKIAGEVAFDAIVTDVGSTKRSVVQLAGQILHHPARFVGSHPMAGSEKRGVEFARSDLFDNALCILTPTAQTALGALASVESFWQTLAMRTLHLSPDEHDRCVAQISHLPHALAALLVAGTSDEAIGLAGKGFLDFTRIAGGDGALWRDILIDNRDNVRAAVARLQDQLRIFGDLLEPQKQEALREFLDAAAKRRQGIASEPA
jgi:prephenate dehydrogenase